MSFRDWLSGEMERQGLSRREVARRMAEKHPEGVTPQTTETYRRAIRRYLEVENPQKPTEQTRNAIADALGVDRDQLPGDDDEDEDLGLVLFNACRRVMAGDVPPKLKDWVEWGVHNGVFQEKYARKEMAA